MPKPKQKPPLSPDEILEFVSSLFEDDLHAKRVRSLADGTLGVLTSASLGVHAIGRGLASARGLLDRHAVKQVDRLLSNDGVDLDALFAQWVPYIVGDRDEITVNLDWTEFDRDDQSMIVLSVQTSHGRSTPLLWTTVVKSELAGQRNDHEDALLIRLRQLVPRDVKVTVVADRGFSDHKLYAFLEDLDLDYVIRFRSVVHVTDAKGETRKAREWLGKGGRSRLLRHASVTDRHHPVATVLVVRDAGMKDAWCLVASDPKATSAQLKRTYGKRFSCEETFRDVKDLRFGLGMSWNRIGRPVRRDRMMFLAALAHALLTLLGEAGERAGLDRGLKTNTSKKRSLSLFRQGLRWYELIPNMPDKRLRVLMEAFEAALGEHEMYRHAFGAL